MPSGSQHKYCYWVAPSHHFPHSGSNVFFHVHFYKFDHSTTIRRRNSIGSKHWNGIEIESRQSFQSRSVNKAVLLRSTLPLARYKHPFLKMPVTTCLSSEFLRFHQIVLDWIPQFVRSSKVQKVFSTNLIHMNLNVLSMLARYEKIFL